MTYQSKWERLSDAMQRVIKSTGVSQQQARADLCCAISDGSVKVRAKLLAHATRRGMLSSETVLSGEHFEARQIQPDAFDWEKSFSLKPWFIDKVRIPGFWNVEQIEVFAPDVTNVLCSRPNSLAQPSNNLDPKRKVRAKPLMEAVLEAKSELFPNGVPSQRDLPNKSLC